MEFMNSALSKVNVEDNTLYDLIYNLVFFAKIDESEDDIRNGRVMTIEESKERLRREYANINVY